MENRTVCYKANTSLPAIINTWPFTQATDAAWEALPSSALDAIVAGCTKCEVDQCDGTVGYGGSPDENGETTLDAMIMDGTTFNIGAVGALRSVKNAIGVARAVLDHTTHTLLAGKLATDFAVKMGFTSESLETDHSRQMHKHWKMQNCQPNYWMNVVPDPKNNCGPYNPTTVETEINSTANKVDRFNHDTIGMIAIGSDRKIAAGTSTNGMNHKIPGRVGDSPIPGAGAYADDSVGAAVATGDGDIMMRFLPTFKVVESMRHGSTPDEATAEAINAMLKHYAHFSGAVLAINKAGDIGAACTGMAEFPFCVRNSSGKTIVHTVACNTK